MLDDKVVVLGAHGLRDVDGKQPVTVDTVFPIGSCTKAFTAMAAALAQEAGVLTLDDGVHRWLPGVKFADAERCPFRDRPVRMTTQGPLGDKILRVTSVTFNTSISFAAFAPVAKLVP